MKKVDSAGRIVLPKDIRESYNLDVGQEFTLVECEDYLKIMPLQVKFEIANEDMKVLRKLYLMLYESGLMDDYYDEVLSRITKKTENKCEKCKKPLFLTTDNNYKCFNCE